MSVEIPGGIRLQEPDENKTINDSNGRSVRTPEEAEKIGIIYAILVSTETLRICTVTIIFMEPASVLLCLIREKIARSALRIVRVAAVQCGDWRWLLLRFSLFGRKMISVVMMGNDT